MRLNKVVCIQSTKLKPKQNRSAIGIPSNNFSLIARVDYVFSNDTNFIFDECFCCWRCCFYCCSGILLKCRSPMYLRLFLIPHRHLPIPVSIYFAFCSTISLSQFTFQSASARLLIGRYMADLGCCFAERTSFQVLLNYYPCVFSQTNHIQVT